MPNRNRELAHRRLGKAENDLISARHILAVPDGPADTVCFHAQQAAEKAIKAWLTYRDITFPKTHNLVRLLDVVEPPLLELEERREQLAGLSIYAVEIRHPDDFFEPSRDEAANALSLAEEIVAKTKADLDEALQDQG